MFETSCPKRISGSDISSRNYSTLIVLPSVPPLPNTSFVPMPYLINIWKKTTTVRVFAKFNELSLLTFGLQNWNHDDSEPMAWISL